MGLLGRSPALELRRTWADFEVPAFARRLRFRLESGDPGFNLMVDPMRRVQEDNGRANHVPLADLDVRMVGMVDDRRAELVWRDGPLRRWGLVTPRLRAGLDARLTVATRFEIPELEIVNRQPYGLMQPFPRLDAEEQPFEDDELDDVFELRCEEPVGPMLVEAMVMLHAGRWVHVRGGDNAVSFLLTPYSVGVLQHVDELLEGLCVCADAMEEATIPPGDLQPPAPEPHPSGVGRRPTQADTEADAEV